MLVLLRVVLALLTCPLLGAFLTRSYVAPLLSGDQAELLAWAGGMGVGALYALLLAALALSPAGSRRRAVGDLVLLMLCALCLADVVSQITGAAVAWSLPVTAGVYGVGFLVVLRRVARREVQVAPPGPVG
jgi:hypothetical protein